MTQQSRAELRVPHRSPVPVRDDPRRDDAGIREVSGGGQFVLGPRVAAFEQGFARYLGSIECAAVNPGTAALHLGLMALGLQAGDEVIIPANTFMATAEAVLWAGGRPVLVDVSEDDANLDPAAVEAAITARTRGIVPVHLYGQPARLDEVMAIAKRHGLFVLEDACQAHGALYRGRKVGTFGEAGAFSFYPGKNLGAYGEGGALVTNDPTVAAKVKALRDHGQDQKYSHTMLGHNFRLEAIQGAVLDVKLPFLDAWNASRRRVASWYREDLAGLPLSLPFERPEVEHVYHLFVVRSRRRDDLQGGLRERGVETLIHYPIPLHLQPALSMLGHSRGAFPVAERLAEEILSLPIYPEMERAHVRRVAAALAEVLEQGGEA
jgi:dTDP-4-amino-4,6-dideoxygalactose transaminase